MVVPDPASADTYDQLYADYVLLHDYFGRGANEVMHRLRALRDRAHKSQAPIPQQREEAGAWQSTS
jgi:L-ribulokinase